MGSVVMDRETLAPEEVSLLTILSGVGGCAPAGGLLGALRIDRKVGRRALDRLVGSHLLLLRPMLGEELVQMTVPAWELLGLPAQPTRRLTYKRIRTGDLNLQYHVEFGRHLSAEVFAGLPQERKYQEIQAKLANLGREIGRRKSAKERYTEKVAKLLADPEASEKDRLDAEGRRSAAEREIKQLRQQRQEIRREHAEFLGTFRAVNRLESLGVFRDPVAGEGQTWVALDLGYLSKTLPETLQRCDAVAAAARAPWQLLVWGVARNERAVVEEQLARLVESGSFRRAPQAVKVLPFARSVK